MDQQQAELKTLVHKFFAELTASEPDLAQDARLLKAVALAKEELGLQASPAVTDSAPSSTCKNDADPMDAEEPADILEPTDMAGVETTDDKEDSMEQGVTIPEGVETINHSSIVEFLEQAQTSKDYTPLVRRIGQVFRDSTSLNFSFLGESGRPDIAAVQSSFQALQHASVEAPQVLNALDNAIEGLVASNQYAQPFEQDKPEWINQFLIVLEYPRLLEFCTENPQLLLQFFKCVASLNQDSHEELMAHWGRSDEEFHRLFELLNMFITVKLMMTQGYTKESFSQVGPAVHMLGLLYKINLAYNYVELEDFYNDGVNETVDLKSDFISWKRLRVEKEERQAPKLTKDSFCEYPFILNPASKAKVMHLDAGLQQNAMYRDAMMSNMFSGRGGQQQLPYLVLRVNRDNMVFDTMNQIAQMDAQELKKPLKVQFVGEEGVDEGGVQKEFFLLMIRQLLDPQYAMFKVDEDTRLMWFNSGSYECNMQFELIGVLMGVAIYNSVILDVKFPTVLYRRLMGQTPTLSDLAEAMPSLASGLQKMLDFDGDVEECFGQTFEVTRDVFGEKVHTDLKEGGSEVNVTNANREEYVELRVAFELVTSVEAQYKAFKDGFMKVCGGDALELFRPDELELLICGNPDLDFEALEQAARYEDGFTENSPVMKYLWTVVHGLDLEDKKKFLMFVTGSDRSPVGGLSTLTIVVSRNGPDSDRLPTSHTCFNHLLLPEYPTMEKLKERLMVAISHSEGFGTM